MKRLILPAVLLVSIATICIAQEVMPSSDAHPIIRGVERRLHVTDQQRGQVRTILTAEAPTIRQIHEQLAAEHGEMVAASSNGVFNEAQARAIASKYAQSNEEAMVEREKVRTELMAILTPEQQKKFEALRTRFSTAFDQHLETLGDNL